MKFSCMPKWGTICWNNLSFVVFCLFALTSSRISSREPLKGPADRKEAASRSYANSAGILLSTSSKITWHCGIKTSFTLENVFNSHRSICYMNDSKALMGLFQNIISHINRKNGQYFSHSFPLCLILTETSSHKIQ